jgi:GNAT superfamily N-acetyltransferase
VTQYERLYGAWPEAGTPLWLMHPFFGLPQRRLIEAGTAEHLRATTPGLWLAPPEPLAGPLGAAGYELWIGSTSVAMRLGDELVGSHTGTALYVLPAHRRRGVASALALALLRSFPRAWRLAESFTPASQVLHQRAYRALIAEVCATGRPVHPAIPPFLAAHVDGAPHAFPL